MRRAVVLLVAASAVLTCVGCGDGEGIGETASQALAPHVRAVRVAATAGNRDAALTELVRLRQEVGRLRTTGELSAPGAASVLEAALEVERQLTPLPAPSRQGGGDGGRPVTTGPSDNDDDQNKDDDDARKRAEEAAKKAGEDAKKQAEEAKKAAEERGRR